MKLSTLESILTTRSDGLLSELFPVEVASTPTFELNIVRGDENTRALVHPPVFRLEEGSRAEEVTGRALYTLKAMRIQALSGKANYFCSYTGFSVTVNLADSAKVISANELNSIDLEGEIFVSPNFAHDLKSKTNQLEALISADQQLSEAISSSRYDCCYPSDQLTVIKPGFVGKTLFHFIEWGGLPSLALLSYSLTRDKIAIYKVADAVSN